MKRRQTQSIKEASKKTGQTTVITWIKRKKNICFWESNFVWGTYDASHKLLCCMWFYIPGKNFELNQNVSTRELNLSKTGNDSQRSCEVWNVYLITISITPELSKTHMKKIRTNTNNSNQEKVGKSYSNLPIFGNSIEDRRVLF